VPIAPKKPRLRLPRTLAYTSLHCAIAATLACSARTDERTADAGPGDASQDVVAHDSPSDCDGPATFCGNASCPIQGAWYCGTQCPPGCDPFV
jgi:hypothetical protein